MTLEVNEKIIILTGEKWADKRPLAKSIAEAIGPKVCTILHYDELYQKVTVQLGEKFTPARAKAKMTEQIARALSIAMITNSYLILDTDIVDIAGFETLLKLIEYVAHATKTWFNDLYKKQKHDDKEMKDIKKHLKNSPPKILHVKIITKEEQDSKLLEECAKEYSEVLNYLMGDEGREIAKLLNSENIARLQHERVEYSGLLYKTYDLYSENLVIREAKLLDPTDVQVKTGL